MLNRIQKFIKQQNMFNWGDRVVVGVSGGADSMCLLHVLLRIQDEYSLTLFVVHINHMLRGSESDSEEEFVRSFCINHGISVKCFKVNVPEVAKLKGISFEEAARQIRYEAFQEVFLLEHCHKIAIAHNMNDNAETVLFHLFRGSKMEGMSGIHAVNHSIVRPLLETKREEIEEFMESQGYEYCIDSSNLTLDYTRNKIRNRVLQYVTKEINEKSTEHIVAFAKEMEQLSFFMHKLTSNAFERIAQIKEQEILLDVDQLMQEDIILRKAVVKMAIQTICKQKKDLEEVHITSALSLLNKQAGKEIHLPYHIIVSRGYTTLIVKKIEDIDHKEKIGTKEYHVEIPGKVLIDQTSMIFEFELISNQRDLDIPKNCYTKWFDYDKIKDAVVIRTRQQGDFLQINSKGGKKTVKSILIEKKIPKDQRDEIYLVTAGAHVLWIPEIRTSEAFLIDENTTTILSVTLKK